MKRFFCFILCFLTAVFGIGCVAADDSLPTVDTYCFCQDHLNGTALLVPGDLNKDGTIGAKDALLVLKCATSPKSVYNFFQKEGACISDYVADVNGDGKTDAKDALDILKVAVGKLEHLAMPTAIPNAQLYEEPTF